MTTMYNENHNLMVVLLLWGMEFLQCVTEPAWWRSCLYTSDFLRTYSVSHFQIWYLLISTPGMRLSAFCVDIARNRDLITLQGSSFYFWNVVNVSNLLTVLRIEVFLELVVMGPSSCLEDY